MARLKEEGEHFKRLQSTRGHFQPMSERLCPSRGILSLTKRATSYFGFPGPRIRVCCPLSNLISLKMPGLTLLLVVTHHMQPKLSLSLLHLLHPSSHHLHLQLLPILFHLQCHQELFHKTLACHHFTSPLMTKQ